ncbi:MAG: DUF4142 domain-containing protein [Oceanicaulis sp.]
MFRTITLAASVSALALAACAEEPGDDAEFEEDRTENSGMATANGRMADDQSDLGVDERRADADARMEGGMEDGMDRGMGAETDEPQSEEEEDDDFTYGSEYSEAGMGTAPPTDAIQDVSERVLGMTDGEIEEFDGEAEPYVRAITNANRFLVEAGRIAAERGGESEIRELGEDIAETHGNQLESLREAIDTAGLGMEPPQEVDDAGQDVLTALSEVEDVNFDPVFVRQQTELHEALNALHEAYAESGSVEILVTLAEASSERTAEAVERIRNDHEAALDPN